jgi:sec-independent protein translocase protein TatC
LYELRGRLLKVVIALIAGALLGYSFHGQIISFLLEPLGGEKLIYLTPGGGFDFIFKVSLYIGFAFALPVAVYQLYRYLAPLMRRRQNRRLTAVIIITSCLLAISGMLFGYFVALPAALQFLTGFAGEYIQASLTASSYLNFITAYSIGLAALFQLPIILLFINMINGPLKPSTLFTSQRYVVLGALILAAIITPTPDVVNQAIVAGPVMLVYQLGVGMVLVQNRRNSKRVNAAMRRAQTQKGEFIAPKPHVEELTEINLSSPPAESAVSSNAAVGANYFAPKTQTMRRPSMDIIGGTTTRRASVRVPAVPPRSIAQAAAIPRPINLASSRRPAASIDGML